MPIKVHCGNCKANFQAKDSLAGKRVKCPKCSSPIVVGQSQVGGATAGKEPGKVAAGKKIASAGVHNPLLGLLDEAQVASAIAGPMCPFCAAEIKRGQVICLECGHNLETGDKLKTIVIGDDDDDDEGGIVDATQSDASKILAKAERDIDAMPVSADGQDFGEGGESYFITLVAGLVLVAFVGLGITIILTMDVITQYIASHFISFLASVVLALVMATWITIVAFKQKPIHGVVCIATAGLWCVVYGFMQGRDLIIPTIILLASFVIGGGSGAYCLFAGIYPTVGGD